MVSIPVPYSKLLHVVEGIVLQAGSLAMQSFRYPSLAVEQKGDLSPVTATDKAVEAFLKEELRKLMPGAAWIGEESPLEENERASTCSWIVDPIDGTKAFVEHDPTWAISVALEVEGEVMLGVVHAPALNQLYTCVKGEKPKRNSKPFQAKIRVPFPWSRVGANAEMLRNGRFDHATELYIRGMRSCALALCEVASGGIDSYLVEHPSLGQWDVAAGKLIVEAAGGRVRGLGEFTHLKLGACHPREVGDMIAVANGSHLPPLLKRFTYYKKR